MSALKVALSAVPDEGLSIDVEVRPDALRPDGAADFGLGPVHVQGMLEGGEDMVQFRGVLSGVYTGPCDRCVKDVEWPFSLRVVWTFLPRDPDMDDGDWEGSVEQPDGSIATTVAFDGVDIDLARQAWDEIALAMPSKFPPLNDEKTHCLACGEAVADLVPEVESEAHLTNKGLAGLKELFPDLPPAPEKE